MLVPIPYISTSRKNHFPSEIKAAPQSVVRVQSSGNKPDENVTSLLTRQEFPGAIPGFCVGFLSKGNYSTISTD